MYTLGELGSIKILEQDPNNKFTKLEQVVFHTIHSERTKKKYKLKDPVLSTSWQK